jgi:hypothetical protein
VSVSTAQNPVSSRKWLFRIHFISYLAPKSLTTVPAAMLSFNEKQRSMDAWTRKNSRKNNKSTGNYYGPSSFSADTLDGAIPLVDCRQGGSTWDDADAGPDIRCVDVLPSYETKNADDSASAKSALYSRNALSAPVGDDLEAVSCGGSALMGADFGCASKWESALMGADHLAYNSKWECPFGGRFGN